MSAASDIDRDGGTSAGPQRHDGETALPTLVRPDFFPGQLLTARDMSDIVNWTRANLALARWRDGWGVVRGLNVLAESDAPLTLSVGSGYAVDSEGRNIVVTQAARFDLGDIVGDHHEQSGSAPDAVDIAIAYHEDPSDPKPVLDQNADGARERCVFTRTDEGFRIIAAPVEAGGNNGGGKGDQAVEAWRRGFGDCLTIARRYLERFPDRNSAPPGGSAVSAFLHQSIAERPLELTPGLSVRIDALAGQASVSDQEIIPILFAIIQDYRLTYSASPPPERTTGARVPLARIHLAAAAGECGGERRIVDIDLAPPRRRPLQRTPQPAPDGFINVAPVLGQPLAPAAGWLARRGLSADYYGAFGLSGIASVEELIGRLDFSPFVAAWDRPAVAFQDDATGRRVVALTATMSDVLNDLTLVRNVTDLPAVPGEDIELHYRLTNTGRTRLDVTVRDSLFADTDPPVIDALHLDPGEDVERSMVYRVPETLPPPGPDNQVLLHSTIEALAEPEGGQAFERRMEAVLPVTTPLELHLDQRIDALIVRPGDEVNCTILLENAGHVGLDVTLSLHAGGETISAGDHRLAPRSNLAISQTVRVPVGAGDRFAIEAVAEAEAPDGRRLVSRAHYILSLVETPPSLRALFCLAWLWLAGLFGR